jgi:ankyrin repeat protein
MNPAAVARLTFVVVLSKTILVASMSAADLGRQLADAARKGKDKNVLSLLKAGASVDAVDKKGKSALLLAIENGHEEIAGLLVLRGASVDNLAGGAADFALSWLISEDDPSDRATLLRKRGATADSPRGRRILRIAAGRGEKKLVERCLDLGVDINARDQAVRLILEKAGDVTFQSEKRVPEGPDALVRAIQSNHPEVVALLLERGAEPNRKFVHRNGEITCFPLPQVGKLLCPNTIVTPQIPPVFEVERTPLCTAADLGHVEILRLLLDKGAKENPAVCSASELAQASGHSDAAELIRAKLGPQR